LWCRPPIEVRSQKKISPCQELSNYMWHTTCKQASQGDSWLLVVGSQIGSSFGHNLCFKYSNGIYELILDIYIPRTFQWYKELFNPMSFDPCNCFMKIWKSIETIIPKWEPTWDYVGSFLHTLLHSREHKMWFPSFTLASHLCKFSP